MNDVAIRFRPAATSAMERLTSPDTCECCGREYLKKTVKVTDGAAVMWMGTGCAAKACGIGIREFGKTLKIAQDTQDAAEREARAQANREYTARWTAHLNARCPQLAGDIFRQIEALGGYDAAKVGFAW